jgi:hypothetical protein
LWQSHNLAPETKIKLTPETNPYCVQTQTKMYLALSIGLLFVADWLLPSFKILDSLPLSNTEDPSRNLSIHVLKTAPEKHNITGSNIGLFKKL